MSDSNRLQMTLIKETTLGTTPGTPRMRTVRVKGESLKYEPKYLASAEIRSDRMSADSVLTATENSGTLNYELSYPVDLSPLSELFASGMYNTWTNTPSRDNDGTADSVILGVATSGTVITVVTGTEFVAGHLVRCSGFGVAGNNGTFVCTTGSATVPAFAGSGITDEAAPAAAARMKVCGIEGAAGDYVAAADGITCTAADFTKFGLAAGMWVKIGGTAAANKFATTANNSWARITAVAANKLTLDNLPTGWTTDDGATKLIRIFFGDYIKNGTTINGVTIERGFMDQTTPTYIVQKGMVVGQMDLNFDEGAVVEGSFTFNGMSGSQSTTSLDASPDAATTNSVMTSNVNVGRISENGAAVVTPNFVTSLKISLNNNTRLQNAVGTTDSIGIGSGVCAVTGSIETYFGSNSIYAKLLAGTPTNISTITAKNNQAVIVALPRVVFTGGAPSAGAQNQDVKLSADFAASYDTLTGAHIRMDRLEYYEV